MYDHICILSYIFMHASFEECVSTRHNKSNHTTHLTPKPYHFAPKPYTLDPRYICTYVFFCTQLCVFSCALQSKPDN